MPAKSDNLIARHEYILQRLQSTGTVAIDELCATLGAMRGTEVKFTKIRRRT
jgi:DeoR family transcriptional regulator of aga operon